MSIITWLRIGMIGLPLAGALAVRLLRQRYPLIPRRLAMVIFGLIGLAGLSFFFINRFDACILASGRKSCLIEGTGALSLFWFSLVLALLARADQAPAGSKRGRDYPLLLLLTGAWAGLSLADNLLVFLLSLNLLFYVIYRWCKKQGLSWRILTLRDDYKDDLK
jgi:hypothetical protein